MITLKKEFLTFIAKIAVFKCLFKKKLYKDSIKKPIKGYIIIYKIIIYLI